MNLDDETEIGGEPENIPGIYNYCDGWCERCLFKTKCYSFKIQNKEIEKNKDSFDKNENEAFWNEVDDLMEDVRDLMEEDEDVFIDEFQEFDLDLDEDEVEELMAEHELHRQKAKQQPISVAARRYMETVYKWSKNNGREGSISHTETTRDFIQSKFEHINDDVELTRLEHAFDIVFYYHMQIWVKVNRALTSSYDDLEHDPEFAAYPKDSDGSAKVALLGIDQSIAAWSTILKSVGSTGGVPDESMTLLVQLRSAIERRFPNARNFHRPGFDDE